MGGTELGFLRVRYVPSLPCHAHRRLYLQGNPWDSDHFIMVCDSDEFPDGLVAVVPISREPEAVFFRHQRHTVEEGTTHGQDDSDGLTDDSSSGSGASRSTGSEGMHSASRPSPPVAGRGSGEEEGPRGDSQHHKPPGISLLHAGPEVWIRLWMRGLDKRCDRL